MGNIQIKSPQRQVNFKRKKIFDSKSIYHEHYYNRKLTNSLSLNHNNTKNTNKYNKFLQSGHRNDQGNKTQRKIYNHFHHTIQSYKKQYKNPINQTRLKKDHQNFQNHYKKTLPSFKNHNYCQYQNQQKHPLTQRNLYNDKSNVCQNQYSYQNINTSSQLFRRRNKEKFTMRYHEKQFQKILQQQKNSIKKKISYPFIKNNQSTLTPKRNQNPSYNNQQQQNNMPGNMMNSAITTKHQPQIALNNQYSPSILPLGYQKYENKLNKLRMFRQQISKLNSLKEDFLIHDSYDIKQIDIQTQRIPQHLPYQQQNYNKLSEIQNVSFKNLQASLINLNSNQISQEEAQNNTNKNKKSKQNSSLSINQQQQIQILRHHQRCKDIVKKVRNFNDFLNQVKKKIKHNTKVINENSNQLKSLSGIHHYYHQNDSSFVKRQKNCPLPLKPSGIQRSIPNLKCINLNLKLQNQKIQLQKYKKLFQKELSKQHSIQKITIQDKQSIDGKDSSEKIVKIQYYDLQDSNIKLKKQDNQKQKQQLNNKLNKKYQEVTKNIKELGVLLRIQDKKDKKNYQIQQKDSQNSLNSLQSTKKQVKGYYKHQIPEYQNEHNNRMDKNEQIYQYIKNKHETSQKFVQQLKSQRIQKRIDFISKLFNKVNVIGQKQKQNQNTLLNYLKSSQKQDQQFDSEEQNY